MPASALMQRVHSTTGTLCSILAARCQSARSARLFSRWGSLYPVLAFCLLTGIASPAQTFTTLSNFNGAVGNHPVSTPVQGFDGNFYGTAQGGGHNNNGTVFQVTPPGALTAIYIFCVQVGCPDGSQPNGLIRATDGNFYGTTTFGGANKGGTVFKITPSGTLSTLYSFCAQTKCTDGEYPEAGLFQASDGSFYGTTSRGGTNTWSNVCIGCGTVFKITPSGTLTKLYNFCSQPNCADGGIPYAALVQSTNGRFYGTTLGGSLTNSNCPPVGCGTVFTITPSGSLTTLHTFAFTDGASPAAGLVQATDGNFYGTTFSGGITNSNCSSGCGTVFKVTPSGSLTTLHSFAFTDGIGPQPSPVQATDGNFYGTTPGGGPNFSGGTAFKITSAGTLTTLYFFCFQRGCTDGATPEAGVMQATNGTFYGTTVNGGSHGNGTVFSLAVGLGPFVETLPTFGKVGAAVTILGNNLTGASSVTFHGTAATFTVLSSSEITTTVPTGATTGKIKVTTPTSTLNSNVVFRVQP